MMLLKQQNAYLCTVTGMPQCFFAAHHRYR